MSKRRAKGDPGAFRYRDGWRIQLDFGWQVGPDGKRRRVRPVVDGDTKAEVTDKARALRTEHERGHPVNVARQTVAQYLHAWLEDVIRLNESPKTYLNYEQQIRHNVVPYIGHHQLVKLQAQHLQRMFGALQQRPTRGGGTGLATSSLHFLRRVLNSAFEHGVATGALKANPLGSGKRKTVKLPKLQRSGMKIQAYTTEQADHLLAHLRGDRLEALYHVALTLGARQGELLAFRRADLDFERQVLHLRHKLDRSAHRVDRSRPVWELAAPKNNGVRSFPLRDVPGLIEMLRAHCDRQDWERRWHGAAYEDNDLLFCQENGKPFHQAQIQSHFKAAIRAAGLPDTRFHDLRHGALSRLVALGVPLPVVQQIAGHASLSTTMIYLHNLESEAVSQALGMAERSSTRARPPERDEQIG